MNIKNRVLIADCCLIFVALSWGIGFVAMKGALESFPPFYLLAIRFITGFLLMSLFLLKRMKGSSLEEIKAGALIGIFLFLGFSTQTVGLQYTTAGKQAFLTATYVVLIPFLSWMIKRAFPGIKSFIASGLCLTGMGFLTLQEGLGFSMNLGDALTLLCAVFYACHVESVEYFAKSKDPIVLAVVQIGVVGVLSLLIAPFFETIPTQISMNSLVGLGFTIIFCTVLAFLIQNISQRFTPSTHVAILLSLESLFGAIAGVMMLGEIFTFRMIIGCAMIFAAVIITEVDIPALFSNKPKEELNAE